MAPREESDLLEEEGRTQSGERSGATGSWGDRAEGPGGRGENVGRHRVGRDAAHERPGRQNPGRDLHFHCLHCRTPAWSSGYEPRGTAEAGVMSGPQAAR